MTVLYMSIERWRPEAALAIDSPHATAYFDERLGFAVGLRAGDCVESFRS